MRSLLVLSLYALALALGLASGAAGAARSCASVDVKFLGGGTSRYPVKVLKGGVSCTRARAVLKHFTATGRPSRRWFCAVGHGGDTWAATCATVSKKTVRAYNPR